MSVTSQFKGHILIYVYGGHGHFIMIMTLLFSCSVSSYTCMTTTHITHICIVCIVQSDVRDGGGGGGVAYIVDCKQT